MNLGRAEPFGFPVVSLDQVVFDLRYGTDAGQRARGPRTLQGTVEDFGEHYVLEPLSQPARMLLSLRSRREVRQAGVLAGDGPRRVTVSGNTNYGELVMHDR